MTGIMLSAAWPPTLAKNARMGHPRSDMGKEEQSVEEGGPPSITVSALSRDTCTGEGFDFPFVEGFGFAVALGVAFAVALLMRPRPAFRILRWKFGSTNHLSGHSISDHDSLFRLPDSFGEARRPIRPTMSYWPTRVPLGQPCMRTSCA